MQSDMSDPDMFVFKCKGMIDNFYQAVGLSNMQQTLYDLFSFLVEHEDTWTRCKGIDSLKRQILAASITAQTPIDHLLKKPMSQDQERMIKSTHIMARDLQRRVWPRIKIGLD